MPQNHSYVLDFTFLDFTFLQRSEADLLTPHSDYRIYKH